jgi:hypothetical protein
MPMIAGEYLGSGSADLLGGFELALGDTPLQLFEPGAHAAHRLEALGAFERQASSECTMNTRMPGCFETTSCTRVFGGADFSRAAIPSGHSIQGPVALWI